MQSIRLAYAKCYQCIKEGADAGAGAEKDVIQFGKYSICLCEKHLNQVVGKMFEQDKIENIPLTETIPIMIYPQVDGITPTVVAVKGNFRDTWDET